MGGVGIALVCPTVRRLVPPRFYHDIDLAAPSGTPAVGDVLLPGSGYDPARRFNTLNGAERLLFHDPDGRRIDVFIGTLRMCHTLSLRGAFTEPSWSLPPADLVLTKLQIVELTERDGQDLLALFADFELTGTDPAGIAVEPCPTRVRRATGVGGGRCDDNLGRLSELWRDRAGSRRRGLQRRARPGVGAGDRAP